MEGIALRNRRELEAELYYPNQQYRHLAGLARAMDGASCAPRPAG